MEVTRTLYRYFGLVGGPIQVLALLASAALTWRLRGRAAFHSTLVGTSCLALSVILWFVLVQPVNAAWAEALSTGPEVAVQAHAHLGDRWEYGHVIAFVAWLLGFSLLVNGLLQEALGSASSRA